MERTDWNVFACIFFSLYASCLKVDDVDLGFLFNWIVVFLNMFEH